MKSVIKISIILFVSPLIGWGQLVIDSLQEYEILYFYEPVYSDSDFESFKKNLLSNSKTENDSLRITNQVNKLKEIQQKRLDNDTAQLCRILFVGEPIDFKIEIDDKELEFNKPNFTKIKIPDCYPHFENQCEIASYARSNRNLKVKLKSKNLSFDFNLDLSYSRIKIENNTNIPLLEITTKPNPEGGPPIPIEKIVTGKGAIEINHKWSN
ncbi:MAG: hypothetical protein DWQ02_18470 [Bacteroidetes bacterium]|nr:MAG: hypothetical protein DWQ02_18470 [Bacteroidota bacterium]